jgi:hypothetical protein
LSGTPSVSSSRRSIDPDSVALALRRWLFSGSCQSAARAFCAWREARKGRLAFEYPETNGHLRTYAAALEDLTPAEFVAAIYAFDLAVTATGLTSFGLSRELRLKPDSGIAR